MVNNKLQKKGHQISEKKIQTVKELSKLIDSKKTLVVATTFNLLSHQLQAIRKNLRGKADVKFVKKNVALRAIEGSKREGIKEISKYVTESPALLISDEDAYDLATILSENKYPAKAKTGQNAKADIVIQEGPTDLMPGAVLTELGNVGLKA
ncbi:MAG: 50S ribosomal protein L10, partial [Nanoarchaeota archaeon]|nr:50S ribosomal protein L10 [Nanoarchaeota archaeon]